jgi:hypothetical protein
MATVATSLPRTRPLRLHPIVVAVVATTLAAGVYAWMRLPVAASIHAHLLGWCTRFAMQPQDWHCRTSGGLVAAAYVGGSLLIGLGVALPGVILAASGRRLSAIVPLGLVAVATAVVPLVTFGQGEYGSLLGISPSLFDYGAGRSFWITHAALTIGLDALLLSVSALAVGYVSRRRARPAPLPRRAARLATLAVVGAVVGLRLLWSHAPDDLVVHSAADTWIALMTMGVFAAMLGTDRRFWPWAIAPVAVLLSLGPAMAVMSLSSRLTAFSWFSDVVPLACVGLVASAWRPLAERLVRRGKRVDGTSPQAQRRFRPTVALNTIAVMLVAISVLMQRTDPLPIQISVTLPTYLGERNVANDVRTKQNLDEAMRAMRSYRAEHGTFEGFDASVGESLVPSLAWSDDPSGENLVVRVTTATGERAQLLAASASGSTFCLRAKGSTLTYGVAEHGGASEAIAACGSMPWTSAALKMFDVEAMCDGMDDQVILVCRAVQRLIRRVLVTSHPSRPVGA